MSEQEFSLQYLRFDKIERKFSLREVTATSPCVFLQPDKKCSIYPVRPKQCSTYPFWPDMVATPQTWERESKLCEGINHSSAEVTPYSKIKATMKETSEGWESAVKPQMEESKSAIESAKIFFKDLGTK
eukprot:TRINITY_DN2400_c0_g1_i2.p1 TRINITY_DN2400_c0_g1~~TRINITY_DN2400_c0_g1_i2.p1  ORF type:complete len:129 (+),score=19.42 TRINITY_DN2400_c0_g1_i2:426-812(+)